MRARYTVPIIASACLGWASSFAATDCGPTLGGCTATANVFWSAPQVQVLITAINDLSLGIWDGASAPSGTDAVCVFVSAGTYKITASSSNEGGTTNYRLTDGGGNYIVYGVSWEDTSPGFVALSHGVPLIGQIGDNSSSNCSGGTDANVKIDITVSAMTNAVNGSYVDVLTLLVAPD